MLIIDNYLSKLDFNYIINQVSNHLFNWNLVRPNNNSKEDDFQLSHMFVEFRKELYLNSSSIPFMILQPWINKNNYKVDLIRAKANCFFKTLKNKQLGYHKDIENNKNTKTMILYLETSNGYTEFEDNKKIKSVENRIAIFDSYENHQTVTQTDKFFRKNININFNIIN